MRIAQHFDAIGIRHLDIGDDHVIERAVDLPLGILSRLYGFDLVALAAQGDVQHFADRALVVANQNVTHAPASRARRRGYCFPAWRQELWFRDRQSGGDISAAASRRKRRTKTLPSPILERAHTLPSCACTI